MSAGLALCTALRWQSAQLYPLVCRAARAWQLRHTELPGVFWPAWNLPLWQVPQLLMPEPRALACSLFEWHGEHVFVFVTLLACCALAAGPVPVPL